MCVRVQAGVDMDGLESLVRRIWNTLMTEGDLPSIFRTATSDRVSGSIVVEEITRLINKVRPLGDRWDRC